MLRDRLPVATSVAHAEEQYFEASYTVKAPNIPPHWNVPYYFERYVALSGEN